MSRNKRYFTNTMPDYDPIQPEQDFSVPQWKQKISEMISDVVSHQPPGLGDCDGGLYVGCIGVGYMLYHVSQSPVFASDRAQLLEHAVKYVQVALKYAHAHKRDEKTNAAFLLGNVGVYAVAAAVYHALDDSARRDACTASLVATFTPVPTSIASADELFVGRAGRLAAARWLRRATAGSASVPAQLVQRTAQEVVDSGRRYARANNSPAPLMYAYYGTEYLGAAHGLSSMLQELLYLPSLPDLTEVHDSATWLAGLQTAEGDFPCAADEMGGTLMHWCHGAPGVALMLARAYVVWRDDRYLRAAEKCGEAVWQRGLLRKGPGTCHGLAGSGYTHLLLYRLTRHPRYLHRARQVACFLNTEEFRRGARTPDCPYSLYEGLAGTVCFLVDLLRPEEAAFPFQDVFE